MSPDYGSLVRLGPLVDPFKLSSADDFEEDGEQTSGRGSVDMETQEVANRVLEMDILSPWAE